jgi:hypothetical protein
MGDRSRYSLGSDSGTKRLLNDVKQGRLNAQRAQEILFHGVGEQPSQTQTTTRKPQKRPPRSVQYNGRGRHDDDNEEDDDEEEQEEEDSYEEYKRIKNEKKKKAKQPAFKRAYRTLIDDDDSSCPLCCSPLKGCFRVIWYCVLIFVGFMCLLVLLGWLMKIFMTIWPWL